MQPSDIYMALEVSKISEKPMQDVISSYKENNGKGWGVIAKKMGIKPGSKKFKALKNRIKERKHLKEKKKKKLKAKSKKKLKKNKGKGKK